ncbi:YfhO family protein [Actinomadura madurae]|uniref:YfhO family protein n=1 Tax=Actinomadura madurae TaxID=1993 RepID=UPI0024E1DE20|nr:YfhO family protein [Actinomadura madurae]
MSGERRTEERGTGLMGWTERTMPRRLRHVAPGAKTLSAVLTLSVFCLSGFVRGTVPFGSESRSLNDLGNQFVPMHAHLAGLLRGTAEGDLFFNWNSGMGVPFLADFYLYLASPLALIAALFPPERIDLAIFIVTAGRMALASVAMTVYLNAIAPRDLASSSVSSARRTASAPGPWTTRPTFRNGSTG